MSVVTVRNLDEATRDRLKARARTHGRSMEAEAREILTAAVTAPPIGNGLGSRIAALFADLEVDELETARESDPARVSRFEA